jgi:hypothetical protein
MSTPAARVHELHRASGATRNLPLSPQLRRILDQAANETNLNVNVISGGQPPLGSRGRRIGSIRHDVGGGRMGAADVQLTDPATLRVLAMTNPQDRTRMAAFVTLCVRAGAHGVGAGLTYMGPNSIHIGGGSAATWGGLKGEKAPPWLVEAHAAGRRALA